MNVKGMIGLIAAIAAIGIALGAIVMIDGPDNGNGYGDRTHIKTVGELEPGDYNLYKVTYIDDKSEAIYEMEERFSMMLTDQDCSVDIYINDRYDHMEYTSPYYFIADFSASIVLAVNLPNSLSKRSASRTARKRSASSSRSLASTWRSNAATSAERLLSSLSRRAFRSCTSCNAAIRLSST